MISPELKQQIEKEAEAEMIYEPKYGGKDRSGYDTMHKYEVNGERYEAYEKGALKYAELWVTERSKAEMYKNVLETILNAPIPANHNEFVSWVQSARVYCQGALL